MKKIIAILLAVVCILSLAVPTLAHEPLLLNHQQTCTCHDVSYLLERYDPETKITINLHTPIFDSPAKSNLAVLASTCYFTPEQTTGKYIEIIYGTHTNIESMYGEFEWDRSTYLNGHEHSGSFTIQDNIAYESSYYWDCDSGCNGGLNMHRRVHNATGRVGGYLYCQ